MIVHNVTQPIFSLNQKNIVKKLYNKLMLKNRIIANYIILLSKDLADLYNIIEIFYNLVILKIIITINNQKKVHNISVRRSYNKS
jgi:hypothetical protein